MTYYDSERQSSRNAEAAITYRKADQTEIACLKGQCEVHVFSEIL